MDAETTGYTRWESLLLWLFMVLWCGLLPAAAALWLVAQDAL